MITNLDIVCEQGVSTYTVGRCNVKEIKESEYLICGDAFPCFIIVFKDETELEVRTVQLCNVRREALTEDKGEEEVCEWEKDGICTHVEISNCGRPCQHCEEEIEVIEARQILKG